MSHDELLELVERQLTNNYDDGGSVLDNFEFEEYISRQLRGGKNSREKIIQYALTIRNRTGSTKKVAIGRGIANVQRLVAVSGGAYASASGGGTITTSATGNILVNDRIADLTTLGVDLDAVASDDSVIHATAAGVAADAANGITVKNLTRSLASFYKFIENNPVVVKQIDMTSGDASPWDGKLNVYHLTPFNRAESSEISLNTFYNQANNNDKKITVRPESQNAVLTLDDKTVMTVEIPGVDLSGTSDVSVTMLFTFALVSDYAKEFNKKVAKAVAEKRKK